MEVKIILENFNESIKSEFLDSVIIYTFELRNQKRICKKLMAKGLFKVYKFRFSIKIK